MNLRAIGAVAAAVLLAAAPAVLAQGAAEAPKADAAKKDSTGAKAPEIPKPAPEMAMLDYFEGTWTCEGQTKDSPFGPGGKITSSATIHDAMRGFWQAGEIKGTMPNMPAFEGRFHTTYDPSTKQYTMLWVDSMGAWARSTSSGWQGDKMVYEGEMHMGGQKAMGRDTFMKSGADTMKHSWEMQMDGKWTPMGDETCKKTSK
jgi:hypothetical protein